MTDKNESSLSIEETNKLRISLGLKPLLDNNKINLQTEVPKQQQQTQKQARKEILKKYKT